MGIAPDLISSWGLIAVPKDQSCWNWWQSPPAAVVALVPVRMLFLPDVYNESIHDGKDTALFPTDTRGDCA